MTIISTIVLIVVFVAVLIYVILLLGRIARAVEKIAGQLESSGRTGEDR
jgi:uncharacterized membrane protein